MGQHRISPFLLRRGPCPCPSESRRVLSDSDRGFRSRYEVTVRSFADVRGTSGRLWVSSCRTPFSRPSSPDDPRHPRGVRLRESPIPFRPTVLFGVRSVVPSRRRFRGVPLGRSGTPVDGVLEVPSRPPRSTGAGRGTQDLSSQILGSRIRERFGTPRGVHRVPVRGWGVGGMGE